MQLPQTQYVERDGISIAYQVVGDGPVDLVVSPGFISHLDLQWADPGISSVLTRLASFSRLILYDKPGTGLSDPIRRLPTLEERVADLEAVLDAAGSERAVLIGVSEGGPTALLMAAMRPSRVISLVVYGSFAVWPTAAPEDFSPGTLARFRRSIDELEGLVDCWGDGARLMELFGPSASEQQKRAAGMFARAAASPRMARALIETVGQLDIRDLLPSVNVPTLVLHLDEDQVVPSEMGKWLAEGVPNARFVTIPGVDHNFWMGDPARLLDEIERFVTGSVHHVESSRVLVTVLFTDIVGSTTRAAQLGDSAWRELLQRHDALIDRVVSEHRGRVVKHIGDGALSAFDGPAMAMRCAEALNEGVGELAIQLRSGVHTGECEVIGEDLGGLAVHIGARIGALAGPGEIVVSNTVKELVVGSDMQFTDRGEHQLRGVPGVWRLYALGDARVPKVELDGAVGYMRRSDRVAVTFARRMPRVMRLVGQLAARGASPVSARELPR